MSKIIGYLRKKILDRAAYVGKLQARIAALEAALANEKRITEVLCQSYRDIAAWVAQNRKEHP